jgi:hypothetical protein
MKQNGDERSRDTVPLSRGCREYHKILAVPYPARGKTISAIAHICMYGTSRIPVNANIME